MRLLDAAIQAYRRMMPPFLREWVHGLRVWVISKTYRRHIVTRVFGGSSLTIVLADPMAAAWYGRGGELLPEIRLLRQGRLGPGSLVFNLGAHQGIVALQLLGCVAPSGTVVALEANPYNARIAEENRRLNPIGNLIIEPKAIGSRKGTLKFSNNWAGQTPGGRGATVEATTIDDLARAYGWPDVLYIDVEGFECEALAGARETLNRHPDMYIEVHIGCGIEFFGGTLQTLLSFIDMDAYQMKAIKPATAAQEADLVVDFDESLPWLAQRFYLVALRK